MPLNAEARTLLDLMEAVGAPPLDSLPPEDARRARAELAPPVLERCHETVELDAGGVPARLYRPSPGSGATGLVVWFHGGGWVLGDLASHDNICHSLALRSGHAVLSVDYRLAPEAPFPAGLGDCIQATRWAHANAVDLGIDPERIAVGEQSRLVVDRLHQGDGHPNPLQDHRGLGLHALGSAVSRPPRATRAAPADFCHNHLR